jgi:hypothetical protein
MTIYLQDYNAIGSLSASTVTTGSGGTASFTFTPSNTVTTSPSDWVYAFLGNPFYQAGTKDTGIWDYGYDVLDFNPITTAAASPATVTFSIPGPAAFPSTYYVTTSKVIATVLYADVATSTFSYTVADKFGNPDAAGVTFGAGQGAKFTALSGGGFFDMTTTTTSVTIAAASGALSHEYSQGSAFGTIGLINVVMTGSYPVTGPFTVSGTTGQIFTSTFDATSNPASLKLDPTTVITPAACQAPVVLQSIDAAASCQQAGKTATLDYQLTLVQKGVPVEFSVDPSSTAVNGDGGFAKAVHTWGYTDATGKATAVYTVDTGAGAIGIFNANVSAPINGAGGSTHYLGGSGPAGDPNHVITVAGAPSTFNVEVKYTTALNDGATPNIKNSVNGTTVYVNVFITDAYGNAATNPGPNQIQITLTPSAGVLSATTVYIVASGSDTKTTIGAIAWTLPKAITSGITLTASGVLSGVTKTGKATVNTVSALPTFAVTSPKPLSGVIYSKTTAVVFLGQANASIGYPSTVKITSVGYKIGTNPWQTAPIVTNNQITWSIAAVMTAGLNTIKFNATDSNSNTFVSSSYKVLVDSSPPDINFVTKNNANLSSGATVTANVIDKEGDLNATSVNALATNLNTAATKSLSVAVSGTNNVGSSVTYGVTLSGLVAGNWSIALGATDYAGNTNTTTITVHVIVPFAQSVVINSAAKGTLGAFTGISVSATNLWTTSQNLVVFAVFKNSAGQTVAVATGGLTLSAGGSGTAFATSSDVTGLPSGSYTVSVFVITTSNNPVSLATSISVSL